MKKLILTLLAITLVIASAYAVTVRVSPQGSKTVTATVGEKVGVFTEGTAKVYQKVGAPNFPARWRLLTRVTNREYTSSVVTSPTSFRIDADSYGAWVNADATPDVQTSSPSVTTKSQVAPAAKTSDVTLTIYNLLGGIITGDNGSGGNAVYLLPTGISMDGTTDAVNFGINASFDWVLINLSTDSSTDTITITGNTSHTLIGSGVVNANKRVAEDTVPNSSATFRTRKTATDTYTTYRIN